MIPYGRQHIDEDDIKAVERVLRGDYLTTGPAVGQFEEQVAQLCESGQAIAVSSGTAALHIAMLALGIGPGDEVVVPPMTFAATANCVCYVGATPVFADVCPETLLMDTESLKSKITNKTKAVIAVDYAGQPCEWDELGRIAADSGVTLIADSCHAIGATYKGRPVAKHAALTVFSFHPVKHITTGEGGMLVTDDEHLARQCRLYRNHGITTDSHQRDQKHTWFYEMEELGFNYRMTDIQAALGESQLKKLPSFLSRRREIAAAYDELFLNNEHVRPLKKLPNREHAYHLYVVRVPNRNAVFTRMREQGIGVNVHYIPVHLHPFYVRNYQTKEGHCPVAEAAYEEILSLPIFSELTQDEVVRIADILFESIEE